MKKNNNKGFTLVELIVTVGILAIILALGAYYVFNSIDNSKQKVSYISGQSLYESASLYAVEFKTDDEWYMELDENNNLTGRQFACTTLQAVIDMGFLKNTEYYLENEEELNQNDYIKISRDANTKTIIGTYSTDNGVCSNFDSVVPSATFKINGTEGTNGWYKSNLDITIDPTVGKSGIKEVSYYYNDDMDKKNVVEKNSDGTYSFTTKAEGNNVKICINVKNKLDKTGTTCVDKVYKIDTQAPVVNLSTKQITANLNINDNIGTKKYYFGQMNPESNTVDYQSINSSSYKLPVVITKEGKYYLMAIDDAGNTSEVVTTTYHKIAMSLNNSSYGSTSQNSLLVVDGTKYTTKDNVLTIDDGRTMTITPTAITGYTTKFNNFSSVSGTITENQTITANLERKPISYTIKYYQGNNSTSAGSTQLSGTTTCVYASNCALKAYNGSKPSGWTFAGWTTSQNSVSIKYTNSQTITESLASTNGAAVNLYAVFLRTVNVYSGVNRVTNNYRTQYYNPYTTTTLSSITLTAPTNITYWTVLGYRDDTSTDAAEYGSTKTLTPPYNGSNNYYAVYSRKLTVKYSNNTTDEKIIYLNANSTTTSSQQITLKNNSDSLFLGWTVSSQNYSAGNTYNPNLSYNASSFEVNVTARQSSSSSSGYYGGYYYSYPVMSDYDRINQISQQYAGQPLPPSVQAEVVQIRSANNWTTTPGGGSTVDSNGNCVTHCNTSN